MTRPIPAFADRKSLARDAILMVAAGLFLAALGPFGSITAHPLVRFLYWPGVIVGGGVIGVAVDEAGGRRFANPWLRWAFSSVVMTPGVCVLVWFASRWAFGPSSGSRLFTDLAWQVLMISAAVMGVRQLIARRPEPGDAAPAPRPGGDTAFRQRLSARRREARLIAVEADDHYLRVHTDAGDELITLRFADALADLAGAPGFQVHRSWWAAADAIEGVRWRRGRGEMRLAGGLTAPVSRTYAARLKAAGWF
ncbi:MAG TPA: LytTR family DNA-binding domain-containing protein [Phenylobacterium sp.]|uniref:LytTR family DNA-binding domain-containing protein n=1 Tax=Phenylobacterium sp. TaxID=1871053 RepID=UPI002D156A09|nr:LytTR family DNA-binding domain-containing protein [Phenylobacterium sp.]HXA37613.1 LytTR family DNA-binding domain-containing protein [Phenylobacterium sp.]